MTTARDKLAQRIQRHADALAHLSRLRAATARARTVSMEAFRGVDASEAELRDARERAPQDFAKRMLGEEVSGPTVAEAEASLAAARTAYDEIVAGERVLEQQVKDAAAAVQRAADYRDDAVADVLTSEGTVARLLDEFNGMQARLAAVHRAIHALPSGCWPRPGWDFRMEWSQFAPDDSVAAPLVAAVESLKTDATAPLPGADVAPPKVPKATRLTAA